MKQIETERNRTKQNETECHSVSFRLANFPAVVEKLARGVFGKIYLMEQIRTNTHGPFRSERSGAEREEEIKI
jgi:hypothetical protein